MPTQKPASVKEDDPLHVPWKVGSVQLPPTKLTAPFAVEMAYPAQLCEVPVVVVIRGKMGLIPVPWSVVWPAPAEAIPTAPIPASRNIAIVRSGAARDPCTFDMALWRGRRTAS